MRNTVLIAWSGTDNWYRARAQSLETPDEVAPILFDMTERAGGLSSVARSIFGALGGRSAEAAMLTKLLESEVAAVTDRVGLAVALDLRSALVLKNWRDSGTLRVPLVGICDRLDWDDRWGRCCDQLLLIDGRQREAALNAGVLPERGLVGGGWLDPVLAKGEADKASLGLDANRRTVLVRARGIDHDLLGQVLFQLGLMEQQSDPVFDVVGEPDAVDYLRRRAEVYGVSARLLSRSQDAARVWRVADCIVGLPLVSTVQRALQLAVPLLAVGIDSEDPVALALRERGIGAGISSVALLTAELQILFEDRGQRALEEYHREKKADQSICGQVIRDGLLRPRELMSSPAFVVSEPSIDETPEVDSASVDPSPLEAIGPKNSDADGPVESAYELELAFQEANRQVTDQQQAVTRWEQRLELARAKADQTLIPEAQERLERHRAAMHAALAELAKLDERRKALPGGARRRSVERSFRDMELDDALADLKRRMGGN